MTLIFVYKYLFHTVGIFNMIYNLATWFYRLYLPFEGSRAADFYRP
jgi:hypothetical protein